MQVFQNQISKAFIEELSSHASYHTLESSYAMYDALEPSKLQHRDSRNCR